MAIFYGYSNAIFGTQTTVDGATHDYGSVPPNGSAWRWSGTDTNFSVREEDDLALNFNGDVTNEQVPAVAQIGGSGEQTVEIGGIARQVVWDFTFTVTSDDGTVFRVAVIDVDLNNDDDLNDAGEDGYFLVFPDGIPPANTDLTAGAIIENDNSTPHSGLGATVVCFAKGTMIRTPAGDVPIEALQVGHLIDTLDGTAQPIRMIVNRKLDFSYADDALKPIEFKPGSLGTGLPERALCVSPQHRILITSMSSDCTSSRNERLVAAKGLLQHRGVRQKMGCKMIEYYHLIFDKHEVIFSEGVATESFYPGPIAVGTLDEKNKRELYTIFPELTQIGFERVTPARQLVKAGKAERIYPRRCPIDTCHL